MFQLLVKDQAAEVVQQSEKDFGEGRKLASSHFDPNAAKEAEEKVLLFIHPLTLYSVCRCDEIPEIS